MVFYRPKELEVVFSESTMGFGCLCEGLEVSWICLESRVGLVEERREDERTSSVVRRVVVRHVGQM